MFITFSFVFLATACFSQQESLIVEGVNINETDVQYIEATLFNLKLLKPNDLECYVDWEMKEEKGKNYRIVNEDGSPKTFKSRVDIFNYLHARGWEYVVTHTDVIPKVGTYIRYVFERKG